MVALDSSHVVALGSRVSAKRHAKDETIHLTRDDALEAGNRNGCARLRMNGVEPLRSSRWSAVVVEEACIYIYNYFTENRFQKCKSSNSLTI